MAFKDADAVYARQHNAKKVSNNYGEPCKLTSAKASNPCVMSISALHLPPHPSPLSVRLPGGVSIPCRSIREYVPPFELS